MTIDAEAIADRRRLRRKLVVLARARDARPSSLAVGIVGSVARTHRFARRRQTHIARISVDGFIAGNQRLADLMQAGRRFELGLRRRRCPSTAPAAPRRARKNSSAISARSAGQEAPRRLRRRHGGIGRLHHGDRRRPHRGARDLARRLHRRAVSVSRPVRPARSGRREGRGGEVGAAQGRAEPVQADPPGGPRGARSGGQRHL